MEPVVYFDDVWKKYHIGGSHYRSLREDLARAGHSLVRGVSRVIGRASAARPGRSEFCALKGLRLQINKGERGSIIGPNGAGKTTALRVMSRISYPTRGTVRVHG